MLIFTNRALLNKADETAFGTRFEPGSERIGFAQVQRGTSAWQVSDMHADASEADAIVALMQVFAGARPVLVYLHGNNNTPASCFERCARFASLYNVEVVGFSWPSEGVLPDGRRGVGTSADGSGNETNLSVVIPQNRTALGIQDIIGRYKQAKLNAELSIDALAHFFRVLGGARLAAGHQPYSLAVHSLGAHFLRSTLDVAGNDDALLTAHNVALLAACTRAAGHREWLQKLASAGQIFVTYNNADTVLAGAQIADGGEIKLGANPGGDLLDSEAMRYIDFTGASNDLLGHNYFVDGAMSTKKKRVLKRIFNSEHDIQGSELPRNVYPVGCDERTLTCFMAAPRVVDGGGDGG